jgi:hypothetical protein
VGVVVTVVVAVADGLGLIVALILETGLVVADWLPAPAGSSVLEGTSVEISTKVGETDNVAPVSPAGSVIDPETGPFPLLQAASIRLNIMVPRIT